MADVEFRRFKKLLKNNGYFVTTPRQRMFGYLQNRPALSIKELIDLVDKHHAATVYRNLQLFEKLGIITTLQAGWHSKIELSDKFQHHHHHLTCTKCGKVIILKENPAIEMEITRIGRGTGFKITDHQLEIRGLCPNCQARA